MSEALQNISALLNSNFGDHQSTGYSNPIANLTYNLLTPYTRPATDMVETDDDIYVYVDIPGVNKHSINVDFYNNQLKITGTRMSNHPNEAEIHRREIIYGNFEKMITLPISITNRDSVNINLKNGVLCVHIDKNSEDEHSFNLNFRDSDDDN